MQAQAVFKTKLAEVMERYGLSSYRVSMLTGLDKSTISLVKRGIYHKQQEMEAKILARLAELGFNGDGAGISQTSKSEKRVYRVNRNTFLLTGNVKKLFALADEFLAEDSDLTSSFAIVAGTAGRGKTTAALRYCIQNPRAVYVLYIDGMTLTQFAREIAYEFTRMRPHSFQDCLECIDRATRKNRRLLIVDEADKMPKKYIESLRGINERFYLPIILMGEEHIIGKISSERRLLSRVREIINFEPLGEVDIVSYYNMAIGIEISPDIAQALWKRAQGDFRIIVRDAHQICKILNASGLNEITKEVVEALQ